MLVWGKDGGARYRPTAEAAASWSATASEGAPSGRVLHCMLWTGREVLVQDLVDLGPRPQGRDHVVLGRLLGGFLPVVCRKSANQKLPQIRGIRASCDRSFFAQVIGTGSS